MKTFFKIILQYYLKYVTKIVLAIHRPTVIAVSGSLYKTFVRDEIKKALREKGESVRVNPKNFNTEIGLPLAILNIQSGYSSYKAWIPVIFSAFLSIFQKNFPNFLVLELGVSRKGDMKYLLSIIKPKISVITEITQRYLESFSGMDRLVKEYEYLVKKTKKDGSVILNYDNLRVRNLSRKAKCQVEFFGKSNEKIGWQIKEIVKDTKGQKVIIKDKNKLEKEFFIRKFGDHHAYALVASIIIKNLLP